MKDFDAFAHLHNPGAGHGWLAVARSNNYFIINFQQKSKSPNNPEYVQEEWYAIVQGHTRSCSGRAVQR